MQPAAPKISMCPDCGRPLEKAFAGGLGCMACWLGAGISGEEDESQDSIPDDFGGYEQFGVYKIDRREDGSLYELGHGAMGITYRAMDTILQRKVALKIIRTAVAGRSKEARESFSREARGAAALRHENIATVFQFGIHEETGQCFYAMELVDGETLEERVRRAGPLDSRTTIDIAQQVAAALGAAQKRGFIHRDLKPANLMLVDLEGSELVGRDRRARRERTAQRAAPAVKIIDFGLAKALHPSADPMRHTRDGFVGTPAFASPEQFENSALDVRSDIYSLGLTLWFALTGKTPFAGSSCEEIHRVQQSNALPIEQLKSARVRPRLRLLLKSMLALEPAARPGTHELAAELRRCAAQATGALRRRMVLPAAATLLSVASAFFGFHSVGTRPAPPAADLNPALPENSIAVLPFENLTREPDSTSLAGGVHEDGLAKLAKITDLKGGRTATTPAPFVEIDQTVIPTLEQYRTAPQIAKVRPRHIQVVRAPTRERTLWDKLLYGWDTPPAPSVKIDQTVIPTFEQYRTAPQIAKVRHRHKRVVRLRTLWDKVRYGWLVEHSQYAKKN
jgi:serine/threonine protein kinase